MAIVLIFERKVRSYVHVCVCIYSIHSIIMCSDLPLKHYDTHSYTHFCKVNISLVYEHGRPCACRYPVFAA